MKWKKKMELVNYFKIIWKWKTVVLFTFLSVLAGTLLFTFTMTPVYQTESKLVIVPVSDNFLNYDEVRASISALDKDHVANTYAEVAQSSSVINIATENADLELKGYEVISDVVPGTSIITLMVQGPDAAKTQRLAQEVSAETVVYVADHFDVYGVEILDDAPLPQTPEQPNILLNIVLGIFLGLAAGILVAFLGDFLRDAAAAERKARAPFFS